MLAGIASQTIILCPLASLAVFITIYALTIEWDLKEVQSIAFKSAYAVQIIKVKVLSARGTEIGFAFACQAVAVAGLAYWIINV